ncbi:hypothetical protein [Chitinolyticbacter meiyuanensis]|uniref:hypothetical protein n=1 Tax=Chitinolyticbacter meiyuanensis TaxID=682798 RepID=UPI0011E5E7E1|nr:hypothetical protein [Chitinolyticbacter meiyuanensis]
MKSLLLAPVLLLGTSSAFATNFWNEQSYVIEIGSEYNVVVSKILFNDRHHALQFCQLLEPKMKLGSLKDTLNVNIYGKPQVPQTQFVLHYSDGRTADTGFWAWDPTSEPYKFKDKNDRDTRILVQFRGESPIETTLELFKKFIQGQKTEPVTYINNQAFKGLAAICVSE